MPDYRVMRTRHNGREDADFKLARPNGTDDYLLLHFKSPVHFTLQHTTRRILPGECILLTPGTPHAFFPDGCELVHDWMHFIPDDTAAFHSLGLPLDTFFTPTETDFITSLVKKCEMELINRHEHNEVLISALVTELMIGLVRRLHTPKHSPHAEAIRSLRYDVYRHPDRYATAEGMADAVGLSRSRFSVVYHDLVGTSPKSDLIRARVAKASYLLSLGTMSLGEISDTCGYQSIYHFIRQFRAITGTTPGAYRKNR